MNIIAYDNPISSTCRNTQISIIIYLLYCYIFWEIKTRIARLQQDFEQVEEGIRKDLNASAETIDASNKSIMDNLNRG